MAGSAPKRRMRFLFRCLECFLSSTSGLCFYTLRRKRPLLTEVLFIGSCCGLRFHEPLPCSCIARGERMDMWEPRAEPEKRGRECDKGTWGGSGPRSAEPSSRAYRVPPSLRLRPCVCVRTRLLTVVREQKVAPNGNRNTPKVLQRGNSKAATSTHQRSGTKRKEETSRKDRSDTAS